jgi:phospholipid/cholesterol/gamma-HCH transport system substrate-binding protein
VTGKTNYVLTGLFVLLLTFTFIAVVLWLSAGGGGRSYKEYLVYMRESVSGLSRDSVVKYHGVDVGRVHEIDLAAERPGEVRLLLQIEAGTPVREDTVAVLETQGLTGLAFINLAGGSADAPLLEAKPDAAHPVIRSRRSTWGRLDRAVEELVADLSDITRLMKVLLDDDNQRHLRGTLENLDTLTAALAGRADRMAAAVDDLATGARHLRDAGGGLPDMLARLKDAAEGLEAMAEELRSTGQSVGRVVRARDRDLQRFTGEALPEAAVMINELRRAAENLRRFSERVERDPSVLLRGAPARPPGPGE